MRAQLRRGGEEEEEVYVCNKGREERSKQRLEEECSEGYWGRGGKRGDEGEMSQGLVFYHLCVRYFPCNMVQDGERGREKKREKDRKIERKKDGKIER